MKVLVTGAAGCLGTELCLQLRKLGHGVIGVDNCTRYALLGEDGPRAQVENFKLLEKAGVEMLAQDLNDLRLWEVVPRATHIVHAAAQVCHSRKKDFAGDNVENNIVATVDLLEAARKFSIPFLFISSSKVYGTHVDHPNYRHKGVDERCPLGDQTHLTFFGASKVAADLFAQMYARQYGMTVGVLRPGCFTGPYALAAEAQNYLGWLIHCAKTGKVFRVFGDGSQERDLLHSADLARACVLWLTEPTSGVWNIGGGPKNAETLNATISRVSRALNVEVRTECCAPRAGDIHRLVINSAKFESDYNWKPTADITAIVKELVECVA